MCMKKVKQGNTVKKRSCFNLIKIYKTNIVHEPSNK